MTVTRVTTHLGGTASNVIVGKVAVRPSHSIQLDDNLTASAIAWSHEDDASIEGYRLWVACLIRASCRWTPDPVPDEQCFEAIKAGVDALPPGAKMFLSGGAWKLCNMLNFFHWIPRTGEFYGHNMSTTNLEMISRFFEKYPEYVDRTFLSIKVSWRECTYCTQFLTMLFFGFPGRKRAWETTSGLLVSDHQS